MQILLRGGSLKLPTLGSLSLPIQKFTIHGSEKPLDQFSDSDRFLVRIDIPHEKKAEMRESLVWLGIRDAYLFPDLEHLAQEVTATYEKSTSV